MLKTTTLSKLLTLKALKANKNELVKIVDDKRTNKIVKNLSILKKWIN